MDTKGGGEPGIPAPTHASKKEHVCSHAKRPQWLVSCSGNPLYKMLNYGYTQVQQSKW